MTRRLLFTGSRLHRDGETDQLIRIALAYAGQRLGRDTVLVHGAARGGDEIAAQWWTTWRLPVEPWPADWAGPCAPAWCQPGHRKTNRSGAEYCPLAGPRRNQAMVDAGADLCVAMPRGRSSGTFDCAGRATAAGIEVWPPWVAARLTGEAA